MGREAERVALAARGAISVDRNDAQDILDGTAELMRAIMQRNALAPEEVVSCIFTATNDLNAEFPAVAARALGFDRVPLLCAREIAVPRSLPRVIRVLIHYYAEDDHVPAHVYLGEAGALRVWGSDGPQRSARRLPGAGEVLHGHPGNEAAAAGVGGVDQPRRQFPPPPHVRVGAPWCCAVGFPSTSGKTHSRTTCFRGVN